MRREFQRRHRVMPDTEGGVIECPQPALRRHTGFCLGGCGGVSSIGFSRSLLADRSPCGSGYRTTVTGGICHVPASPRSKGEGRCDWTDRLSLRSIDVEVRPRTLSRARVRAGVFRLRLSKARDRRGFPAEVLCSARGPSIRSNTSPRRSPTETRSWTAGDGTPAECTVCDRSASTRARSSNPGLKTFTTSPECQA